MIGIMALQFICYVILYHLLRCGYASLPDYSFHITTGPKVLLHSFSRWIIIHNVLIYLSAFLLNIIACLYYLDRLPGSGFFMLPAIISLAAAWYCILRGGRPEEIRQ